MQYLLEWDVNDAFYDFPFISNSVSFVKDEVETMQVNYDEDLYNEDLEFFSQSLESFSIDASTVTEASVISDFNDGKHSVQSLIQILLPVSQELIMRSGSFWH